MRLNDGDEVVSLALVDKVDELEELPEDEPSTDKPKE
jgi:hypothetical protein